MKLTITALGLGVLQRIECCAQECDINAINSINSINYGNLKGMIFEADVDDPGMESKRTRFELSKAFSSMGLLVYYSSVNPTDILVLDRASLKIRK